MKIPRLFSLLNLTQNKNEMENKKIETLITAYATALDHQDAAAAETFLDPEFRIVLNNHNNSGTTSILSRAQYLDMIREGKAGGVKRSISFLLTDLHENAAVVKVRLEGEKSVFTNYYSLLKRDDQWLVVNDIPQITPKTLN